MHTLVSLCVSVCLCVFPPSDSGCVYVSQRAVEIEDLDESEEGLEVEVTVATGALPGNTADPSALVVDLAKQVQLLMGDIARGLEEEAEKGFLNHYYWWL